VPSWLTVAVVSGVVTEMKVNSASFARQRPRTLREFSGIAERGPRKTMEFCTKNRVFRPWRTKLLPLARDFSTTRADFCAPGAKTAAQNLQCTLS
jgi:hypothetical protein